VRWIVDFNYGVQDPQNYPRLMIHAEPPEDLGQLADTIQKAIDVGIRVPERWARTKLGIPEPVGNEAVLNDIVAEQARASMPAGLGSFGAPVDPNADPGAGA